MSETILWELKKMKSIGVIHSGGSTGADEWFGNIGTSYGYFVIHHSFHELNPKGEGFIQYHDQNDVTIAMNAIKKAKTTLAFTKGPEDLLRLVRDYFQVCNSEYIIAIAPFVRIGKKRHDQVEDGTGWTVQMAIDMKKTVYVFDDNVENKWYISKNGANFQRYTGRIPNSGVFAGIGTIKISPIGIEQIKSILRPVVNNIEYYGKFKDTLTHVNDDLKFAEAKNLFLATFCGVQCYWFITIIGKMYADKSLSYNDLFGSSVVLSFPVIACCIAIYNAIPDPRNRSNNKNVIFWNSIRNFKNSTEYFNEVIMKGDEINLDYAERIFLISKIANKKYQGFKYASIFAMAGLLGIIYIFLKNYLLPS